MGDTGKLIKNKTKKHEKKLYKKSSSEKKVSKIVSMGYKGKQLKKHEETSSLDKKIISTKIYPKDRINDSTQER